MEDWRIEHNTVRPDSALGYLIPADYAKAWTAIHQPELSWGWTNNRSPINQNVRSGHSPTMYDSTPSNASRRRRARR